MTQASSTECSTCASRCRTTSKATLPRSSTASSTTRTEGTRMSSATADSRKFVVISRDAMMIRIESLGVELERSKFHNENWIRLWSRFDELLKVIETSEPEDRKDVIQALKTINDNKKVAIQAQLRIERTWIALEVALELGETKD